MTTLWSAFTVSLTSTTTFVTQRLHFLLHFQLLWLHFRPLRLHLPLLLCFWLFQMNYCIINFQLPANIHIHQSSTSLKPT
jgi:hypothetical protein